MYVICAANDAKIARRSGMHNAVLRNHLRRSEVVPREKLVLLSITVAFIKGSAKSYLAEIVI